MVLVSRSILALVGLLLEHHQRFRLFAPRRCLWRASISYSPRVLSRWIHMVLSVVGGLMAASVRVWREKDELGT